MPNFAQRNGYEPMEMPFQREAVDPALRTRLWNILSAFIWDKWERRSDFYSPPDASRRVDDLVQRLWVHFFNRDLDALRQFKNPYHSDGAYDVLKAFFFACEWYHVYSFLEALADDQSNLFSVKVREIINEALERHNAAYRFVGNTIAEITSEHEIAAIEFAQKSAPNPVGEHLQTALRMLSDREKPDYRNSIKESISAVEAVCRLVAGKPSATLSDALKKIPNLHPALVAGFDKLYGYTSDASGIRHSLTEQPTNTYSEAKFMLVACSGFVSYLQAATVPR